MPIQQMLLGASPGGATYIEDVFMTNVWTGTGSSNEIDNGVKLSSKGGMVWVKNREENDNNWLFADASGFNFNGIGNAMRSNSDGEKYGSGSAYMTSFDSDGFTVGTHGSVNGSGDDIVAWTFRNSKAFQTLTYEGNASVRTIDHDLGSVPGMVIVKKTDGSDPWYVWHRGLTDNTKVLNLNETYGESGNADVWNSTAPTATNFTLGTYSHTNQNGSDYIAYIFAGGESDAATARSVDFDGSGDYLSIPDSSDFEIDGTNFTFECWFKADDLSGNQAIAGQWELAGGTDRNFDFYLVGSTLYFENCRGSTNYSVTTTVAANQWYHIAGVLDGTTLKLFVNGNLVGTTTVSGSANNSTANFGIGGYATGTAEEFHGKISNLRFVKGTAVYTESFRPPTEPLTAITNTKLLCCNNSSVTGSTVTPGTISSNGDPTALTDSPFDDPDGFVFGEDKDEGIFKCGSYIGNGAAIGPDIYLGWQPQYVMIKRIDASREWVVYDAMRGIVSTGNDAQLRPDSSTLEYSYARIDLTPTGFKPMTNNADTNTDGGTYVYFCVRSQDGYVGKPAEAGTDVFTIDLGGINAGDPSWVSNFPVDMQFIKDRNGTTYNNFLSTRLTQGAYLTLSTSQAAIGNAVYRHDYDNGWGNYGSSDAEIITSWMWKRHKGMDVVCFRGNSANRQIAHGLNAVPEMIIVKQRTSATNWEVYHDGLNGGGNPEQYRIALTDSAEVDDNTAWNDTAPTATHFSLGTNANVNNNAEDLIAFLFSSVSGISKVGVYAGSNSAQSITTGFQPRFVMIKNTANTDDWLILDTFRGWAAGDDKRLYLNQSSAQSDYDVGAPTSTGFDLNANVRQFNQAGRYYIYYAHA